MESIQTIAVIRAVCKVELTAANDDDFGAFSLI